MNHRVDVIVIGDSKNGHEILDKIASSKSTIRVAFVSQNFKSTTTHDYLNVEYFRQEVTLIDYKNRLFGCYFKNGIRLYGTHLIIATGVNYEPFILNNKPVIGVFNTIEEIPKLAKNQPAVVICNKNTEVKFALDVAKKYRQVYLCTKDMAIEGLTEANAKKLDKAENIIVLSNTSLLKTINREDSLQKVELNNYATLNCSAIFVKTATTPAVDFIPENIIQKSELGYLITNEQAESTLVPKCFAVGNCTQKYTKAMEQAAVDSILKDFS